ncbi:MAG: CatB-related O-acetyltransferase, partial [Pseudomonadales bacterium]
PQDEGADKLIIGSFCSIGSGAAFIMAGNQGHRNEWVSTFPFYWMSEEPAFAGAQNGYEAAGDTVIGNDVWMGSEAVVMPGIKIGDGAVIGTRALVTRDVEPYAIVGGNPAKTIRKRFDERSIERLLEMQWWHWSDDQLKAVMPLMTSSNIAALFQHWQEFIRAS